MSTEQPDPLKTDYPRRINLEMTPELEKKLRNYDLMEAIQKACETLSHRRRPSGRFYKREVDLLLMDVFDPYIRAVLESSKQFVHCYEGDPQIDQKPNMYRPRNAVGFDKDTQDA